MEVNGVRHRTGPKVPVILRGLAFLPILLVAVGWSHRRPSGNAGPGSQLGRRPDIDPSAVKVLIMIGVGVVACVVRLAMAVAVQGRAHAIKVLLRP